MTWTLGTWFTYYMQKLIPDPRRLSYLRHDRGMPYKEIQEWLLEHEGIDVSVSAIGSALNRAGLTANRNRYEKHLPWVVHAEHMKEYPARMLRLLGRRDSGLALSEGDTQRLDSWLQKLQDEHALVAYLPEKFPQEGFVIVDVDDARKKLGYVGEDWPADGIPIVQPRAKGQRRNAATDGRRRRRSA